MISTTYTLFSSTCWCISGLLLGTEFPLPFVGFTTVFGSNISFCLSSLNYLCIGERINSLSIFATPIIYFSVVVVLFSAHGNPTVFAFTSFSVIPLVLLIVFICWFSLLLSSGAVVLLVKSLFSILFSYYRLFHFVMPLFLLLPDIVRISLLS